MSVDGPSNGPAPPPWEIHCSPTRMFHNEEHCIEVPHTVHIMSCHGCGALGWSRCHSCLGRGFKRCITCQGSGRDWKTDSHGHRHVESCWHCRGTGRKRCAACGGDGRTVCRTCQGFRQLRCFIKLTITFTTHLSEQAIEHADIADNLLKDVEGDIIFEQTQPRVWPILSHPDEDVCVTSQTLINEQLTRLQLNHRIIMQRQILRAVPVAECLFTWRDEEGHFYVFGNEHKVYAKDYPQKWLCGCVIL